MLNELGVEEGESSELILVEVHHEQLVGGSEFCTLAGELSVKIRHILSVFLKIRHVFTRSNTVFYICVAGSTASLWSQKGFPRNIQF